MESGGSKMSAPSTSGLSVELLFRVIDVEYGYLTLMMMKMIMMMMMLIVIRHKRKHSPQTPVEPNTTHCSEANVPTPFSDKGKN